MKAEVKQQWVDALRSGQYEQGRIVLRNGDNKYCCLGVLTDLAIQSGEIPGLEWTFVPEHNAWTPNDSEYDVAYLDPRVIEWSGISSHNGKFEDDNAEELGYTNSLSLLNDSVNDRWTFGRIADVIEEKF